ncbi:FAD-binding and (Fe-S)-binding domain-containing protein [Mesorhizobium sp. WSM3224]|uniref:FAD-binding and (Fe-S)-binding domain-containing protein n=1 Tax=Mesorhizobium sp. WSM3224 TaxID=1040986 RepID=UPI0012EC93FC|nr:FAD-binding and (Fe-S)-binding domain-containing protein [Mesorhizobium sp. WSM3224]
METRRSGHGEATDISPFLEALVRSGYRGEIARDLATRTVFATDNSIYQVIPQVVLYPREGNDLDRVIALAASGAFGRVPLSARGGGTGTNGQSLTSGVVIDTSRHLNRIGTLDVEAGTVTVEPGVVLDQLNAFLKPYGLFFPPTVSTASRATLGGMVATDASGKGSRIYGKTSDYIEAMDVVLANGEMVSIKTLEPAALAGVAAQDTLAGRIHREVHRVVTERRDVIRDIFPEMNRGLTGYNLKNVLDENGRFRLQYLLAGSEGTLAITKRLTLHVRRLPACRAVVAIRYASFQTALGDVQRLLAADPAAIEILDDKVLSLAREDAIWNDIESVLGGTSAAQVCGLNVAEFVADSAEELESRVERLLILLAEAPDVALDWTVVRNPALVGRLWSLREKCVGLLGRLGGDRQGTAFVEDAAVPPENLPDFVAEFRAILDSHNLTYGMFGHADVGCLHVRPALDMKDPADAALIRPVSDAVAALTKKYGGLLWGEHGRGFRGEYSPFFFGPELYQELCRIKAVFDPHNIFNPGKLAAHDGISHIDRIDEVPLRGAFDRAIAPEYARRFDRALACNGNGACFNWDADDPMCPSYKATRDRRQSPKGRAALLREWTRLRSEAERGEEAAALPAIEDELHASLMTCLSCKACSSQCPIKVDIPAMKAQFLDAYHRRHRRGLRDQLVACMEAAIPIARRVSWLANPLLRAASFLRLTKYVVGLVDLPALIPARGAIIPSDAHIRTWSRLSVDVKQRTVLLVEDTFTGAFDGDTVHAARDLLTALGYEVHLIAARPNGKPLHVLGMLDRFSQVASSARAYHNRLLDTGLHVIGIEPVTVLMHELEYRTAASDGGDCRTPVRSLQSFLAMEIQAGKIAAREPRSEIPLYFLFLHCTEKTANPRAVEEWKRVFATLGLRLETPSTGCCGMAGLFGHEREHAALSEQLFVMSWAAGLAGKYKGHVLATGFSCRCQTKRFAGFRPRHPAEALLDHLRGGASTLPPLYPRRLHKIGSQILALSPLDTRRKDHDIPCNR